ncbi:hypothetical protein E3N88_14095 [Mikania micrantha]|uniref:Uncharacterized protein n=1 Tax=Mikania micrantha TaxID=192012 RepID=A0A5N6P3L4_9ASTR|nr:hypothetical protein E3N88_14095 [Mikania micrantha]
MLLLPTATAINRAPARLSNSCFSSAHVAPPPAAVALAIGNMVCQISSFNKIWSALEGGPDNMGATFYEPSSIPDGFFMLGCYSQPNNRPLFGWILAGKPNTNESFSSQSCMAKPTDYSLIWSSNSHKLKQDGGNCYIWLPTPPEGYKPVGYVVTNSPKKPSVEKIRCVQSKYTDKMEVDRWIWGLGKKKNTNNMHLYETRPKDRGVNKLSVSTGSFGVHYGDATADVSHVYCLKNTKNNLMAMPNASQVEALIHAYSPRIYFHPDEKYFPSSINWYFKNGALLYEKGKEAKPSPIQPDCSNLPQDDSNDDLYWLDLPTDDLAKERVKKGSGLIRMRNDASKDGLMMDTGESAMMFAAPHLGSGVVEPLWLNYSRKWGPKISYGITNKINEGKMVLPKVLKGAFEKFVRRLPNEVLGEEGPIGPKMKNSWGEDEKY